MPDLDSKANKNNVYGAISCPDFVTRIINGRKHIAATEASRISSLPLQSVNAALAAFRSQDGQADTVYVDESGAMYADDIAFYSLCCQMPAFFSESVMMTVLTALDHYRFSPQPLVEA
ncbi:MAG: hypothetical protein BWK73_04770 [Thiothrix lacustris]|uniref:Uncharacterized protein n=1 Tax=Thiothrix lacustris TaxID=525917 RepID=A0A1Y1QXR7_9GAMM|nr:MAG: hypothetical protein BWK73_04770 [Thiothrix lacustris]